MLGWEAYFTLGALALMLGALIRGVAKAEFILAGTLGLLLVAGVVSPADGFAGFANPAVIAIGALFVVAAAVERTDALYALRRILRPGKIGTGAAVFRLMLPTALLSGFLNNTPIVAMLIPRVQAWARETGLPVSKLLIPLSYAAIIGGWLSVIGTSTNLVVHGLLIASGRPGFAFFGLAWVGVPVIVLGVLYYALVGHRALPVREGQRVLGGQARAYQFELRVAQGAAIVGKTVEEAELRTLGDAFLVSIWRPRAGSETDGVLEAATPTRSWKKAPCSPSPATRARSKRSSNGPAWSAASAPCRCKPAATSTSTKPCWPTAAGSSGGRSARSTSGGALAAWCSPSCGAARPSKARSGR